MALITSIIVMLIAGFLSLIAIITGFIASPSIALILLFVLVFTTLAYAGLRAGGGSKVNQTLILFVILMIAIVLGYSLFNILGISLSLGSMTILPMRVLVDNVQGLDQCEKAIMELDYNTRFYSINCRQDTPDSFGNVAHYVWGGQQISSSTRGTSSQSGVLSNIDQAVSLSVKYNYCPSNENSILRRWGLGACSKASSVVSKPVSEPVFEPVVPVKTSDAWFKVKSWFSSNFRLW